MKVKLVFEKSYVENPTFNDCFAHEIEVNLPHGWQQANVLAARCYQPEAKLSVTNIESNAIGGDINTAVLRYRDEAKIIGKLLTYIEATYSDKEQREAQKSIVKELVYGFFNSIHEESIRIVDAHKPKITAPISSIKASEQ